MAVSSSLALRNAKCFKLRKAPLGIILFEMTIQDICFNKSSLIYSPFLAPGPKF